jgi:hypothetical protein
MSRAASPQTSTNYYLSTRAAEWVTDLRGTAFCDLSGDQIRKKAILGLTTAEQESIKYLHNKKLYHQ